MTVAQLKATLAKCPDEAPVRIIIGEQGDRLMTVDVAQLGLNTEGVVCVLPRGVTRKALRFVPPGNPNHN